MPKVEVLEYFYFSSKGCNSIGNLKQTKASVCSHKLLFITEFKSRSEDHKPETNLFLYYIDFKKYMQITKSMHFSMHIC